MQDKQNAHGSALLGAGHSRNERRTLLVVAVTAAMMVVEIGAGTLFGSMALVADGWHMATHAGALGIAAAAYIFARRYADDPRFAFGTGKVGDLAAFASAVSLMIVALLIGVESAVRIVEPVPIRYGEAIPIAILGLIVNIACMWLLGDDDHGQDHASHEPGHSHGARDNNLRAAYIHVATDALTSVLAIAALVAGAVWGLGWFDPAIGLVGAVVIAAWSVSLMKTAGAVLIDAAPAPSVRAAVVRALEAGGDTVTDLHLWHVGPGHLAAIVSVASDSPEPPAVYKARLASAATFSHVTVEVDRRPRRDAA